MREKLYLVDLSNFMHRAAHAMSSLSTSGGLPTGGIYGTFTMISRLMITRKIKHMLICYDWQGSESYRADIYPTYKSNRIKKEYISAQELIIRKMIELLGIASYEKCGYEADDIIGSAVEQYRDVFDVVILTGDKDLLQLVQPGVEVYDSMKNAYYGDKDVAKKFGVRPDQIADYLALAGDKVDSIPGVQGIGPVAAKKLLETWNSVEDIYKNVNHVEKKWRKKLEDGEELAKISKSLTTLGIINIPLSIEDLSVHPVYDEELIELFAKLEFNNGISKLKQLWTAYEHI